MSKDPAVLFYTSDFLTGTFTFTNEQRGMYISLLCLQHQKGRLSEKDMMQICTTYVEDVFLKFKKDGNGFYNERMETEINKRKNYSESRRKNILSRYKKKAKKASTYVVHMENENIDEGVNINIDLKGKAPIESCGKEYNGDGVERGGLSKELPKVIKVPMFIDLELWQKFLDMRKSIKKPMSEHAQELAFKKLAKIKTEGHDITEIIENSIMNSWQGFVLPKPTYKSIAQQNIDKREKIASEEVW